MLHILLLILKIIGIILGILLGVILLALVLVLFVPVHYQMEAMRVEGEGNPPIEIKAKLTWLFHLINARILYPAEVYLRVRVILFTVFRMPPKPKKTKKIKRNAKKKGREKDGSAQDKNYKVRNTQGKNDKVRNDNNINKNNIHDKDIGGKDISDNAENNKGINSKDVNDSDINDKDICNKDIGNKDTNGNNIDNREKDVSADAAPDTKKRKFKFSLKEKLAKIWRFFQNIWYTIKKICDRIREILKNIEYYWNVLQSDTFKQAYSLCKEELGSVFNYIKPQKFKADLVIGMDDPAATGQILSYYGILYPVIGNHVTIVGDFEQKRIEGSVFIKGRIKLFTILKAAKRIYFNKDIKKLLKLFKKEDV